MTQSEVVITNSFGNDLVEENVTGTIAAQAEALICINARTGVQEFRLDLSLPSISTHMMQCGR